mgnify:FL=1
MLLGFFFKAEKHSREQTTWQKPAQFQSALSGVQLIGREAFDSAKLLCNSLFLATFTYATSHQKPMAVTSIISALRKASQSPSQKGGPFRSIIYSDCLSMYVRARQGGVLCKMRDLRVNIVLLGLGGSTG